MTTDHLNFGTNRDAQGENVRDIIITILPNKMSLTPTPITARVGLMFAGNSQFINHKIKKRGQRSSLLMLLPERKTDRRGILLNITMKRRMNTTRFLNRVLESTVN